LPKPAPSAGVTAALTPPMNEKDNNATKKMVKKYFTLNL
jgi:hypothetical protein